MVKLHEQKTLHIEAEGCIVNIREGLSDSQGRKITVVTIIPDKEDGCGENDWQLLGKGINRVRQYKTGRRERGARRKRRHTNSS